MSQQINPGLKESKTQIDPEPSEAEESLEEIDYYPWFQHKYCGIALDMIEDWVAELARCNQKRIESTPQWDGVAIQNRSAEFIFGLCHRMNLAPDVKFTALALFDTFMLRHVSTLYEDFQKRKDKKKDWETIEAKFSGQVTLRLFSCIQIASKMENQVKTVKLDDYNRLLRDLGHSYTKEHVLKSELRVLKTLDYRLNIQSPLVYMETILKLLQIQYPDLAIDEWYPTCVEILETVFLLRDELYGMLLQGILGDGVPYDRHRLAMLQNDYMFLACTVIITAVFMNEEQEDATWMAWALSALTGKSFVDMTMFCGAIVERVMRMDAVDEEEAAKEAVEAALAKAVASEDPPFDDDQPSTSYAMRA